MTQVHRTGPGPVRGAVLLAIVALAPVACSGGSSQPTPEASTTSSAVGEPPPSATPQDDSAEAVREVDDCELVTQAEVETALGVTIAEVVPDPLDIGNGCSYRTADYSAGGGSYDVSSYAPADGEGLFSRLQQGAQSNDVFQSYQEIPGPWSAGYYTIQPGGAISLAVSGPDGVLITQIGGILLIPSLEPGTFADQLTTLAESAYAALGG